MKRICVVGLGYIGLPTAAMFATHGFRVVGVDIDSRVVDALNKGCVHIQEPGLDTLVQTALEDGNLRVSRQPVPADAFVIAVPTPCARNLQPDGSTSTQRPEADLSYVVSAAESIVPYLQPGNLVILESTVPPKTTTDILLPLLERSGLHAASGSDIGRPPELKVAHCPERVLPGRILDELVHNDRVIGGVDQISAEAAREMYASFVEGEIFTTEATAAETVKLMENTYRDVNIALANEFALVAERMEIDVWRAIDLANHHPRVNILKPGPGVGGHCIAVDPWFIVQKAPEITPLIQTARQVNDGMAAHVVGLVRQSVAGIQDPVIACLGLTYKADVDDVRESPAVEVVHQLQREKLHVRAFDPHVEQMPALDGVIQRSLAAAIAGADCAVILTDHSEFRSLSPEQLGAMRNLAVVDARNALNGSSWEIACQNRRVLGTGSSASSDEARHQPAVAQDVRHS